MTYLRLDLFGGFQLFVGENLSRDPSAKKARALFAYLALQKGRIVTRDQLAALLWSRSDHARARHSLSQALSAIRETLQRSDSGGLTLTSDAVQLDPSELCIDVEAFERLAMRRDPESLLQAAKIFKGDFLDGLDINESGFQAWRHSEQERLRGIAVAVLAALSDAQAAGTRLDEALMTLLRLLSLDPLNERAHRALMRLYAKQGRTDSALRQYRTLEAELKRDLGTQPEPETYQLLQAIRSRRDRPPAERSRQTESLEHDGDHPSIVVLPFVDYSDDSDPDCLAAGLSDDLTSDLSRISGLLVISRSTALSYADSRDPVRQIAAELKMRYVLEGSVHRTGSRVRINVRFVDGPAETQIWSDRFDRDLDEVFLLQNEITGRVAAALRLELLRAESRRLTQGPPEDLTSWSYAVRGYAELWTKPVHPVSYAAARQFIDLALNLDASQALAWTGLARLHYIDALYPFGVGDRIESYKLSLKAAETAVALDPDSAEAHTELANALKCQCRYDEAVMESERAILLNPNYEEAYLSLATIKKALGKPACALPLFEKTREIAPHLPTEARRAYFTAWAHLLAENLDQALAYAGKSMVFDRDFSGPHWIRACVFGWKGEKDLAATALSELERTDPFLSNAENFAHQYRHITNKAFALEGLLRAGIRER